MKYQQIFWLEDSPDILGDVLRICTEHGIDKDSLFSRITFAPDYQAGADIVQDKDFDLYILDGDFPEATSEGWKKNYWNFMQQISINTQHLHFKDKYGDGYIGRSTNNFAPFFQQYLQDQNKTIVYSVSTIAPTVAFHYGLPFYSKALDRDMIKGLVEERMNDEGFLSRFIPAHITLKNRDYLERWECGSRFELVERYLI